MTDFTHDTLADLSAGTPRIFVFSAYALPLLLGGQFFLAGQALFGSLSWELHGISGGIVGLPIVLLLGFAAFVPRLRGFGWWAALIFVLYGVQIALATGGPVTLALHPFNAALLLTSSLAMSSKVARRQAKTRLT